MKYIVYVIKSEEGFRYTGMTEDLERRIEEHNSKSKSFWTKRGSNWKIIYTKEFDTKNEALKYERWMKSGHGKKLLKELGL
jgi:putative endonuclease